MTNILNGAEKTVEKSIKIPLQSTNQTTFPVRTRYYTGAIPLAEIVCRKNSQKETARKKTNVHTESKNRFSQNLKEYTPRKKKHEPR